jgi:hypothetical protein
MGWVWNPGEVLEYIARRWPDKAKSTQGEWAAYGSRESSLSNSSAVSANCSRRSDQWAR